jgi:hypothetical protein
MWPACQLADATSMMKIDNDGYIRLWLGELQSVELVHLLSGLDEADCVDPACTDRAEIHGYTEWISASEPVVSVGWDWRVDTWAGLCPSCLTHLPEQHHVAGRRW